MRKTQKIRCAKLCNGNSYDESINLVTNIDETNFKLEDLKVQQGQLSTISGWKNVSIGKMTEFFVKSL